MVPSGWSSISSCLEYDLHGRGGARAARGGLIDETALVRSYGRAGSLRCLDVFENEPLPDDSPLRSLPNAILAPHATGHSRETHLRQGATQVDEVLRFLAGEPLRTEVPPAAVETMARLPNHYGASKFELKRA